MRVHSAMFLLKQFAFIALFTGALLSYAGIAAADDDAVKATDAVAVHIPAGSTLEYERKTENEEFISFSGPVELTGILLAYWQLDYLEAPKSLAEAKAEHSLLLRFYPDSRSSRLLPSFAEKGQGEQKMIQRIFLYHSREVDAFFDGFDMSYSAGDSERILKITSHFTELPKGFLEDREGKAVQPVRIVLNGLASFIEGNHRFTVGKSQTIRAMSTTDYSLAQIPDAQSGGYLSRPWVQYLYLIEDAAVFDAPGGEELLMLEAGTHRLERLGPPRNGWVEVRYAEGMPELRGYIKTAALRPVN